MLGYITVNILINTYKKINNEVKLLLVDYYVRNGQVEKEGC